MIHISINVVPHPQNGHREDNGNYLSVFVELYDGFDRTTRYQYSIEMLYNCGNKHPHKNYRREYGKLYSTILCASSLLFLVTLLASEFANGECWGYKKYYELSRLVSGDDKCQAL